MGILDKLLEDLKNNPEAVAEAVWKVSLRMRADYAAGYRLDDWGIQTRQEEPDYAKGAEILLEWAERFPEKEVPIPGRLDYNPIREVWEKMLRDKWKKIVEPIIEQGASEDEAVVLAIWCEKLMGQCLVRGLHASHTPSVRYVFPCAVRVFMQLREELPFETLRSSATAEAVVTASMKLADKDWALAEEQEPEAVKVWAEEIAGSILANTGI